MKKLIGDLLKWKPKAKPERTGHSRHAVPAHEIAVQHAEALQRSPKAASRATPARDVEEGSANSLPEAVRGDRRRTSKGEQKSRRRESSAVQASDAAVPAGLKRGVGRKESQAGGGIAIGTPLQEGPRKQKKSRSGSAGRGAAIRGTTNREVRDPETVEAAGAKKRTRKGRKRILALGASALEEPLATKDPRKDKKRKAAPGGGERRAGAGQRRRKNALSQL